MSDELELPGAPDDDSIEMSTALKIAAPVIAFGATWLIRKALDTAYERATGQAPPRATDPSVSLRRVIVYAAATAAAVAIVNVAVDRLTAPRHLPLA